jgi:hypothetical protein
MTILKRISPGSAFKIGLVTYGAIGLIFAVIAGFVGMARMALPGAPTGGMMGVLAMIFLPIVYALIGGIFSAIGAMIYNFAARWVGGLQVEIGAAADITG